MFKVIAIIASLAAVAVAVPTEAHQPHGDYCTPATYDCAINPDTGCPGWKVCDVDYKWKYAGDCPPYTHCELNPINKSPYCLP